MSTGATKDTGPRRLGSAVLLGLILGIACVVGPLAYGVCAVVTQDSAARKEPAGQGTASADN